MFRKSTLLLLSSLALVTACTATDSSTGTQSAADNAPSANSNGNGSNSPCVGDNCAEPTPLIPIDESFVSCSECPLALTVVERHVEGGRTTRITLALDYNPASNVTFPGMADIRVYADGARLIRVATGDALLTAEKDLLEHSYTGLPYVQLNDKTSQFVILSTQNTNLIEGGRWLFFEYALLPMGDAPASFHLLQREQTFAPTAADTQLWGADLTPAVVIYGNRTDAL